MPVAGTLWLAIAASVCAIVAMPGSVSAAAKKITYEQAYKRCKTFLDQEKGGLSGGTTSEQHKMARGAACMRKFGYKL